MLIIRENKLIAAILGGLVVMSLLVLLFNDDPQRPGSRAAVATPATSAGAASTATTAAEAATALGGPNIATLDCNRLLSSDDINAAVGQNGGWAGLSQGETCTSELLANSQVFVRIEPGGPNDFVEGAQRLGVIGTPVSDVGDAALWFGGPQADGGGSTGALIVATESDLGTLIFRIVLGRPDLPSDDQLGLAKTLAASALARFPGFTPAPEVPAERPVVTIEHDPVDQSNQSLAANLLARETDGEWTRAAGIVATLRYLAREIDAPEVLRATSAVGASGTIGVLDQSGTDIVRLAREYLEANPDTQEAEAIDRLLTLLLPRDPRAATAAAASSAATGGFRSLAVTTSQEAGDGTCYTVFPDHGDPCFLVSPVSPSLFGDKYVLWFPDLDEWEGWVRGASTIQIAMEQSAITFEGLTGDAPPVAMWLTPWEGASTVDFEDGECNLYLASGAQALRDQDPKFLQQAIASAMARCYIYQNLGEGEFEAEKWWQDGLAWYMSDVVFPDASLELSLLKVPETLADEELSTTLFDRSTSNMAIFEYLAGSLELQGTFDAAASIALTGLDSVARFDRELHGFAKALTDGAIFDQDGIHRYDPPASQFPLTEGITIVTLPKPYGVERVHLSIPSGMYACIEYPDANNLDLFASWRAGSPGGFDEWSSDLPASIEGDATFVITTIEPDGQFVIDVTDIDDDPNCEDDEDEESSRIETPGPPCGFCDPTKFFWNWTIGS